MLTSIAKLMIKPEPQHPANLLIHGVLDDLWWTLHRQPPLLHLVAPGGEGCLQPVPLLLPLLLPHPGGQGAAPTPVHSHHQELPEVIRVDLGLTPVAASVLYPHLADP